MSARDDFSSASRDEMYSAIDQFRETITSLESLVKELRAKVAQVERTAASSTGKFSKGKRKENPKKPGRKPGQGLFSNRVAPDVRSYSCPPIEVPVPETLCSCGGALCDDGFELVTTTDVPPDPKPVVTPYHVHKKRCQSCGRQVRGVHPGVASDQHGATAHRLGPRVYALAQYMHYGLGMTMRKVPRAIEKATGLKMTQGTINQNAIKHSNAQVGEAYQQLKEGIKDSATCNTDDTGWAIGAIKAQLMVFVTKISTIYQVRFQHRNEEVREVIPKDYEGILGTDRGSSYDAKELSNVKQQKCLNHIQNNIKKALDGKEGEERSFLEKTSNLLYEAHSLWNDLEAGRMTKEEYFIRGKVIEKKITEHLEDRQLTDADDQRILNGLGFHHDRGNLVRFLNDPRIEPTNNIGEQELRPGVTQRKVSQCSKNERGAHSYESFKSVMRTLERRGLDVIEGMVKLLMGASPEEVLGMPGQPTPAVT